MTDIEKDLLKYYSLKIHFLSICKLIDHCDEKEICFYQHLALCYSNTLKDYANFLKETYGLYICYDNSFVKAICKKQND